MIGLMLAAAVTLMPGSSSIWTDGVRTWAGQAECVELGILPEPDNPAADGGQWIAGFHCKASGPDSSGCAEWFGKAPAIGTCDPAPAATVKAPNAPGGLTIR